VEEELCPRGVGEEKERDEGIGLREEDRAEGRARAELGSWGERDDGKGVLGQTTNRLRGNYQEKGRNKEIRDFVWGCARSTRCTISTWIHVPDVPDVPEVPFSV